MKKIIAGYNITCVGDEGKFSLLFQKMKTKFLIGLQKNF